MTRDEALTLLLRRAGQREGDTKLKNQIIEEMKLAQTSMEQGGVQIRGGGVFWPNFLISEVSTATTTVDEPRMDLPNDFLMEVEDGALFVKDSSKWFHLEKEEWDILRSNNLDSGRPEYYAALGDYFYLFPVPDKQYTLKLIYYQSAGDLDTDIENRWLQYAPHLLIARVGATMAEQYLYDNQLAQRFQREEAEFAQQLYNAEVAREQANYRAVKGDRV